MKKVGVSIISIWIFCAFFVLMISYFRAADIKTSFNTNVNNPVACDPTKTSNYPLVYEGPIIPGNPLWYLKAFRDKVWLWFTYDKLGKAKLNLLFADKRLSMAVKLSSSQKYDLSFDTLNKSLNYYQKAVVWMEEKDSFGSEDSIFVNQLCLSADKYDEVITLLQSQFPDDGRPIIEKFHQLPLRVRTQCFDHF